MGASTKVQRVAKVPALKALKAVMTHEHVRCRIINIIRCCFIIRGRIIIPHPLPLCNLHHPLPLHRLLRFLLFQSAA